MQGSKNYGEYVDNEKKEDDLVTSSTCVEVVTRVREVLKLMDPREKVGLDGRYDVGSRHHT